MCAYEDNAVYVVGLEQFRILCGKAVVARLHNKLYYILLTAIEATATCNLKAAVGVCRQQRCHNIATPSLKTKPLSPLHCGCVP